jgi:hypothetical protein
MQELKMPIIVEADSADRVVMYGLKDLHDKSPDEPTLMETPCWFFVNGVWDGSHYTLNDLSDGTMYTRHYPYRIVLEDEIFPNRDADPHIPNLEHFNVLPDGKM